MCEVRLTTTCGVYPAANSSSHLLACKVIGRQCHTEPSAVPLPYKGSSCTASRTSAGIPNHDKGRRALEMCQNAKVLVRDVL